ncbi:MAG: hypothetical protein B6U69_01555 [Thermofilum sp. ex4484_15]|nr:MAG: hypothetical protein B6U69_01555 [Thermofilum sp. ex4484_15]
MLTLIPNERALLLVNREGKKYLIIADLHIGFERELAQKGLKVPSKTVDLINRIRYLATKHEVSDLLILGDVKHTVTGFSTEELGDLIYFFHSIEYYFDEIKIICGNHDGDLAGLVSTSKVEVIDSRGLTVIDSRGRIIGFVHGHAWPSYKVLNSDILIMAHIHPVVELRDSLGFKFNEAVWIRAPVNRERLMASFFRWAGINRGERLGGKVKLREVIVMPAFNEYLGGLAINKHLGEDMRSPLLNSGGVILDNAEVFLLDGTYLGKLSFLAML